MHRHRQRRTLACAYTRMCCRWLSARHRSSHQAGALYVFGASKLTKQPSLSASSSFSGPLFLSLTFFFKFALFTRCLVNVVASRATYATEAEGASAYAVDDTSVRAQAGRQHSTLVYLPVTTACSVEAQAIGGTASGAAALTSRRLFQERINVLLSAPMPHCLQSESQGDAPFRMGFMSARERAGSGMATERSLHSSHSPQRNAQASTVRTLPIYEALLQKGRLMQEHRERLQQEAIEREMREVRPAPRVAVSPAPLPVEAPRSARRLPPKGQRIEDRLLQRAKEKHELEEKAGQVRAEREAEDLAVIAPFHPHISAHALATKSRYKEPPPDRAAWRARRLAELAQMCQSSGAEVLEELQDVPSINPRSAKLAALRKAREGLDGVPVPDALLISEHRRRLAQWQAAEAEREARSHAVPSITRHAARMRRVGSVGDRLHAESYEVALRRLQREVAWREAHTPFQPLVTPLGAVTAPRYQREGDTVAHTRTLEGSRILSRQNWVPRDSFQPSINPVSAAIAQRLPETAMERLCRPSAVHSLSSYVDPTSFTDASGVSPSPSIAARSQTRSCLLRTPSAHQQHGAVLNTPSSTLGALPSSVVASLDAYERRRQRRLEALRKEQVEHEQRECTFQPQINAHSSSLTGAFASASGQRGPSAVARRSGEWQQQRERHLETMRQWQAERAAAEQTMATRVRSGARTAAPSSSPLSYSIYGGDGTPWGVEEYLARQQLARAMRQRAQEALERQSVSVDGRDRPSSSSAPPPVSKQMGLDHRVRSSSMLSRRPSPIRSLRPAVPASQEVAIAHMFASAEEASSDGGWRCWKGGEHVMRVDAPHSSFSRSSRS